MRPLRVYFGGTLFAQGDLLGNSLLAEGLRSASSGRYECALPQDAEPRSEGPMGVRDANLKALLQCDAAAFRFDGAELDSGTVAEFVFAKAADIPCVLLRTDFRRSGDQGPDGEPWNLMCSFFPRTASLLVDSLSEYQARLPGAASSAEAARGLCESVAARLAKGLDEALASPPLAKDADEAESILRWAMRFPSGGLEALCLEDPGFIESLLRQRRERGEL